MSWGEAFRYLQKNVFNYTLDTKNINTLLAVLEARRDNDVISEADVIVEPGKKRPLKINYIEPQCDPDSDCNVNICDAGTTIAPTQAWFEITQCTASPVYRLNQNDIRSIDGNIMFSDYAMEMIRAALPGVRENLSSDVRALLLAELGVMTNGQPDRQVAIMNPENAGMNPLGFYDIQREYEISGYNRKAPYIIGGSVQVDNWLKSTVLATANTTIGIDMAKARPAGNLYYDPLINDAFADPTYEHILSFSPDMLKFVSFSENAGIFATDIANIQAMDAMYHRGYPDLINGGLVDPRTGLLWDLDIIFEKCGEDGKPYWKFQWRLNWDIFFLPPRVCNIQGLNSIFHWLTCLPQMPTCGDNPYPSAASPELFSADASSVDYPLVLQSVQIGNLVNLNTPNDPIQVDNIGELFAYLNSLQNNITFSASGNDLRYTGYIGIDVVLNGTTTLTFTS